MDVAHFIGHLRSLRNFEGQIVHIESIPGRPARHGELSRPLVPALREALGRLGIGRLYAHQAEAIDAVRAGQHVMVATGTASGKSLCYNIPVLESVLEEPESRALYLFPTKALAQDQLRALRQLTAPKLGAARAATYDGDTPASARGRVRRKATIVLSNPDMLNVGILPNHPLWSFFFGHLRYVVLDEAHTYRGIFGSHVACLMRRLRRVCALYGSEPQFILCSATIANPGWHAQRLTGYEVVVIDSDCAPHGPRQFVLWNPPFLDEEMGVRRSVNTEATRIFTEMVGRGVRNITFTRARKVAELILLYAQHILAQQRLELVDRVSAYRGGYLAEERRDIERRLFAGDLVAVTATNALELGVDIGQLDATLSVGYPGTIASTWQQAGRAGRGCGEALNILIGYDNPLDQFFMRHPEELFGRPHESALLDPGNIHVLKAHLACAAFERPLTEGDVSLFGQGYEDALTALTQQGTLGCRHDRWYLLSDDYPAQRVNMRGTGDASYLLVDETRGCRIMEEIDAAWAFMRVHPGAIYLHRGEPYLVTELDMDTGIAYARPVDADYYTQVRERNDVHIVRSLEARSLQSTDLFFGIVRVTREVVGFLRKQQFTDAVLAHEPLDLPPYSFETRAVWFEVPAEVRRKVVAGGRDFAGGLHAVEHACVGILPSFAMCDRNDIGGLSTAQHPDTGQAEVFIYDSYPGGVGIAKKGYELAEALWQRTFEAVRDCPCQSGCPSCIQSPKCGNNNEPLDKEAALWIMESLLVQ